jgi:hypothetical protein
MSLDHIQVYTSHQPHQVLDDSALYATFPLWRKLFLYYVQCRAVTSSRINKCPAYPHIERKKGTHVTIFTRFPGCSVVLVQVELTELSLEASLVHSTILPCWSCSITATSVCFCIGSCKKNLQPSVPPNQRSFLHYLSNHALQIRTGEKRHIKLGHLLLSCSFFLFKVLRSIIFLSPFFIFSLY